MKAPLSSVPALFRTTHVRTPSIQERFPARQSGTATRRNRRATRRAQHREHFWQILSPFFLQTQWWSTVCDTPYWTGRPPTDRYSLTHFATLYARRRNLYATLPAILMMMDMMGLRKFFLHCCCSDVTLSFSRIATFFSLEEKKTQHRYACNLEWDENALTLTVVRRVKVE